MGSKASKKNYLLTKSVDTSHPEVLVLLLSKILYWCQFSINKWAPLCFQDNVTTYNIIKKNSEPKFEKLYLYLLIFHTIHLLLCLTSIRNESCPHDYYLKFSTQAIWKLNLKREQKHNQCCPWSRTGNCIKFYPSMSFNFITRYANVCTLTP